MTSMAPCSLARAASRSRLPRPRATVTSGVASRPSGSQRATPTRADPRSMASLTPVLTHLARVSRSAPALPGGCSTVSSYATMSRHVSYTRPYHIKCLVQRGLCAVAERRAATLGNVVTAAAAAAELTGGVLDEATCRQATLARALIDRDHDGRAVRGNAGHDHDRGPAGEPAAHVEGERANPVGAGPVGHPVRDEGHAGDVLRTAGQIAAGAEQLGGPQPLQFPFRVADPGDQGGDPLGKFLTARLELLGQLAHQHALGRQVPERVRADQRLDPADTRSDRRLPEDLHQPELARAHHMSAAAQLAGVVADLDHPDLIPVLLAEQRQRPHRARLFQRRDERPHRQVADEHGVDLFFHVPQQRRRDRARGGEVEPEPPRGVLRARLGGRLAERAAERAVDEVGRGVRAGHRPAPLHIDLRVGGRADRGLAQGHHPAVHDQRSEEHTSELQSLAYLVCRLLLEKKNYLFLFFFLLKKTKKKNKKVKNITY